MSVSSVGNITLIHQTWKTTWKLNTKLYPIIMDNIADLPHKIKILLHKLNKLTCASCLQSFTHNGEHETTHERETLKCYYSHQKSTSIYNMMQHLMTEHEHATRPSFSPT